MTESVKTLSETRQRLSIGEVSRREKTPNNTKKVVRSSVINPKEIVWPEVDEAGSTEILGLIKKLGRYLKIPNRKVPLHEIREVEKSKRADFRREWFAEQCTRVGYDISSYIALRLSLVIGVNCVSKALETNSLAAAIIEKNVNPPIITKLLVPVAEAKGVPMIAIDGLNSAFQLHAGLRCIAVGIKKDCADITHKFHPLLAAVQNNFKKYEEADELSPKDLPVIYEFNLQTPSSESDGGPGGAKNETLSKDLPMPFTPTSEAGPGVVKRPLMKSDVYKAPKIRKIIPK